MCHVAMKGVIYFSLYEYQSQDDKTFKIFGFIVTHETKLDQYYSTMGYEKTSSICSIALLEITLKLG